MIQKEDKRLLSNFHHPSLIRINHYRIASVEDFGGAVGTDEAGDFKFARDNRGMGGESAFVGNDPGRAFHNRHHIGLRHRGYQNLSS